MEAMMSYDVTMRVFVLGEGNSCGKAAVHSIKTKPALRRTTRVQNLLQQNADIVYSSKQLTMTSRSKTILLLVFFKSVFQTSEPTIIFVEEGTTQASPTFTTTQASPTFTNFSKSELECFQTDSVFYEAEGKCYKLLHSGPCPKDQWLVLDKEEVATGSGRLRPVCGECSCCDKPFRAVYWLADGQCHRLLRESKQLCPSPGTVLQVDPFGEGECACEKVPLHARWDAKNKDIDNAPCYPLYQRGPCDNGYIFVPYENTTRCEKDPCFQQNKGNSAATFVAWKDGNNRCYTLGSKGPCAANGTSTFNIHSVTRRPACLNRVNQIVDLPSTCDTDQNGDCRKEVTLPTQTQYLNDLLLSAKKRRQKRKTKQTKK